MMKRFLIWMVVVGVLVGASAAGYRRIYATQRNSSDGIYQTQQMQRRDLHVFVTSTGTVKPVQSVEVGSFVSGSIQKVFVDYNDHVKKGQMLAQIDPRLYKATLAHEQAALANGRADLVRVKALLEQAMRTEKRSLQLQPANAISETDLVQNVTNRKSLEAQVALAEATIQEYEANLVTAKTNLEYTDIVAPVDGIVIDRKVDSGQTVAAAFQTPVMFVVSPDLEQKVHVYASVDEADIGQIREAQKHKEPVTFTVDAYPRDVFHGKISQVRLNPTTVQNVVTYTVVVESPNVDMKLLPGMTANLSFQIQKRTGVPTVPNAALRFYPKPEQVCQRDRAIVEGKNGEDHPEDEESASSGPDHRYVWVVDGNVLAAVPIVVGLSDKRHTEIVSGNLAEGQEVVVGLRTSVVK